MVLGHVCVLGGIPRLCYWAKPLNCVCVCVSEFLSSEESAAFVIHAMGVVGVPVETLGP